MGILYVRVFIENKGKYPVEFKSPPLIYLKNKNKKKDSNFYVVNRDQFKGLISPQAEFNIQYDITLTHPSISS